MFPFMFICTPVTIVNTTYDGRKTVGTRWVASGSGIKSINGGSEYRYVHV